MAAVEAYPEELELGDLILYELPTGASLGFQVRFTIGPWLRVIGPVDGDLAEAVRRPEMANVVIISSRSERRAAKARVVGRFDVPPGSRGEPPYRRPGLGPVAPGVRGTGTWLHAPHGDPLFVAEATEEHRRAFADPARRLWEHVPSLHVNDWDNVRAYEQRVRELEAEPVLKHETTPLTDLWQLDEPYDRLARVAASADPRAELVAVLTELCSEDDGARTLYALAALASMVAAGWAGAPSGETAAQELLDAGPMVVDAALRRRAAQALEAARLSLDAEEGLGEDAIKAVTAGLDRAQALLEGPAGSDRQGG